MFKRYEALAGVFIQCWFYYCGLPFRFFKAGWETLGKLGIRNKLIRGELPGNPENICKISSDSPSLEQRISAFCFCFCWLIFRLELSPMQHKKCLIYQQHFMTFWTRWVWHVSPFCLQLLCFLLDDIWKSRITTTLISLCSCVHSFSVSCSYCLVFFTYSIFTLHISSCCPFQRCGRGDLLFALY